MRLPISKNPLLVLVSAFFFCACAVVSPAPSAGGILDNIAADTSDVQPDEQPQDTTMVLNADKLEYSTDKRDVLAEGNVEILYKGAKLTCRKLTLNTVTKDCHAEGNVRLDEPQGVIEGEKFDYNLEAKRGTIMDALFRANPYFGRADTLEKTGPTELCASKGYFTTCSLDHPHYRMLSRKITVIPGDKLQTRGTKFYIGGTPVMGIPWYNRSLREPFMHVRLIPGKTRDWGAYMLSAWRYNLNQYMNGRAYLDYRYRLGWAQGFGMNYSISNMGKGDYKFYRTDEHLDLKARIQGNPKEYYRSFMRLRHLWDIDDRTNFISEFYQITDQRRKYEQDRRFLKDYFYREYEKDTEPLTYGLLHHNFDYSSFDLLLQQRTNHWFNHTEKLPELKYTLPNVQLGESPFYFSHDSAAVNQNMKKIDSLGFSYEEEAARLDMYNKFSLPAKVAFLQVSPFVGSRQTLYDKGADEQELPVRTVFYTGMDVSTKFYRIFEAESDFLGIEIHRLRHVITPSVGYAYNHEPTIGAQHLKQIDGVDSISRSNAAALGLSSKFQTKRNGQNVDLVDSRVSSSYVFKPKAGDKLGSNLSDLLMELTLLPYSWLRFDTDVTYKHTGDRAASAYRKISNVNYDVNFTLPNERSFGLGQRYQRGGSNQITYSLDWKLTPKWNFMLYHRREIGHGPLLKRGLAEQEYTLSRDLHCWTVDFTMNFRQSEGDSLWLVFRLKAFPDAQFGIDQSYHQPKSGSQVNP